MKIHIQYFAALRDARGLKEEWIEKDPSSNPSALAIFQQLKTEYGFAYDANQIRFAVNGDFAPSTALIKDGDTLVFIPPVSGG